MGLEISSKPSSKLNKKSVISQGLFTGMKRGICDALITHILPDSPAEKSEVVTAPGLAAIE
jgi:hypothetical protein